MAVKGPTVLFAKADLSGVSITAIQLPQLLTEQWLVLPFDYTGLRYITLDGTNLPANQTALGEAQRKLTTLYILVCVGVAGVCVGGRDRFPTDVFILVLYYIVLVHTLLYLRRFLAFNRTSNQRPPLEAAN